ncbi:TIR domain-containing protein [Geodermatophilus sp. URMC 62]|uniref:TIR domain-containing protein n=1 Tax=Geodermatophilus sp. URMC 62 TaxID=3423414 RepID=UPI00406C462E
MGKGAATGHLFLSYSHLDAEIALRLAADLKNAGIPLWMDRLDGLSAGTVWRQAIEQAITTCSSMLALLSPSYVRSTYCTRELARADALGRPVLPLLLSPLDPQEWPLAIEGVQYADFSNWRDNHAYVEAREDLVRYLAMEHDLAHDQRPDAEQRYLVSLIADLESKRGVLQYVTLTLETDVRPEPPIDDEWGYAELLGETHQEVSLEGITDAVERHPRFILLGDPGAGKTTTIRRLALEDARRRAKGHLGAALPVLLQLSQWSDGWTPLDFLRASWVLPGDCQKMLAHGEITLYLDGLNEMGTTGPAKAQLLTQWLTSPQGPARLIVTCRTGDYSESLQLGSLPCVRARELTREQVGQFASHYLGDRATSFMQGIEQRGPYRTDSSRDLFHLATNPYMLTALIYMYDYSPGRRLPSNMGILFRRLIRALWKRETIRGTVGRVTVQEAERAFAQLALEEIEEQLPISVPLSYAVSHVGSEQMLRSGVSANYVTISDDNVYFYHQLMQEYFAATALTGDSPSKIASRVERPEYSGVFRERVASRWDQVFVALCGLHEEAAALIEKISEVDRELAAICLLGSPDLGSDVRIDFIESLLRDLRDKDGWMRFVAARTLRNFPDPIAVPELTLALKDHWGDARYDVVSDYATEALRRIGTPEAIHAAENAPRW